MALKNYSLLQKIQESNYLTTNILYNKQYMDFLVNKAKFYLYHKDYTFF